MESTLNLKKHFKGIFLDPLSCPKLDRFLLQNVRDMLGRGRGGGKVVSAYSHSTAAIPVRILQKSTILLRTFCSKELK